MYNTHVANLSWQRVFFALLKLRTITIRRCSQHTTTVKRLVGSIILMVLY